MSYIEQTLLPGETIIYQARLHWYRYLECWLLGLTGLAMFYRFSDTRLVGGVVYDFSLPATLLGASLVLVAFLLMIRAWLDQITSEFVVTDQRVLIKSGFIRRRTLELLLTRVEAVGVNQGIFGRAWGFGNIIVSGTGGTRENFGGIEDPLQFRQQVQATVSDREEGPHRTDLEDEEAVPYAHLLSTQYKAWIAASLLFLGFSTCTVLHFTYRLFTSDIVAEAPATEAPANIVEQPISEQPEASPAAEVPMDPTAQTPSSDTQAQAAASPGPAYNTPAYCQTVGSAAGGSYAIEKVCRTQEDNARSAIEAMDIPARVRAYCNSVGDAAGGSYAIYKVCVDQEMRAASQL